MNRFRTKKKAKDGGEGDRRVSNDEGAKSMPPLKPSKTFRLGKKSAPEPELKPELDLTSALPASDDFRTSLLMTGLSARFSMLREQDDPTSKLGKASDDSVLFPKRQSRLMDFGFVANGLSDIAEVSSIHSSVRPRPPFAMERTESYNSTDGYGTDDDSNYGGSVMARAKPPHGNNLFGGRQKIYKLPAGGSASMKNLAGNAESGSMGGRVLYDDDVSMSAFQKLREREKQRRYEQEELDQQDPSPSSPPRRSQSPPPSGYNRNRETSSTTASGPSLTRSSTAATSVTSQRTPSLNGHSNPSTPAIPGQTNSAGLDRAGTKARRLYETGLDQHLHNQQHSAMSRLDSLSKQRARATRSPSPGSSSPIATTFNIPEHPEVEDTAPKLSTDFGSDGRLGSFDFGMKRSEILDVPKTFGSPPLSPPMSEGDEQSILSIQPNDRGKATAAGVFTKPVQPYDETKYAQRQLQMQGERAPTPPLRKQSPPRQFRSAQHSVRNRAESNSTYSSGRSRSSSSLQSQYAAPSRGLSQQERLTKPEPEGVSAGGILSSPSPSTLTSADPELNVGKSQPMTFTNGNAPMLPPISIERPPEGDHPAIRGRNTRLWADFTNDDDQTQSATDEAPSPADAKPKLSPVLPTTNSGLGSGLSGMVREHLRSDSNSSSIYGLPDPTISSSFRKDASDEPYVNRGKGNPWDTNDWDIDYSAPPKFGTPTQASKPPSGPKSGSLAKDDVGAKESEESALEREKVPQHNREGSTATQKEREEFKNELASRRKRVQENLRNFAESESRSVSPAPIGSRSRDTSATRASPGVNVLRQTSSRTSLVGKPKDGQSKAMRMLGIGAPTIGSAPSPNSRTSEDVPWKPEDEDAAPTPSDSPIRMPPDPKAIRQARRDAQRNRERDVIMRHQQRPNDMSEQEAYGRPAPMRQRAPSNEGRQAGSPAYGRSTSRQGRGPPVSMQRAPSEETHRGRHTPDPSMQAGPRSQPRTVRDRSASDASGGRSASRTRGYRDDLARAMAEGTASSSNVTIEEAPISRPAVRSPAIQESTGPSPTMNGRLRSNSKAAPGGYFDGPQTQSLQAENAPDFTSPRPSPIAPFSANPTPALAQAPSTRPSVESQAGQGFQTEGRTSAARKRSVNKSEISEPTFVSSTARMTTVNLNEASPLQNININAPPLPEINPRRRQTRTQTMFGGVFGKSAETLPASPPAQENLTSHSHFSAEDSDNGKSRIRQKLRKSSSEGGNLNARARAVFAATPSPALPGQFPPGATSPGPKQQQQYDGNMF